jgi:hypothetical protein
MICKMLNLRTFLTVVCRPYYMYPGHLPSRAALVPPLMIAKFCKLFIYVHADSTA